eukprot:gene18030-biopygen10401
MRCDDSYGDGWHGGYVTAPVAFPYDPSPPAPALLPSVQRCLSRVQQRDITAPTAHP